ncbi:MAG: cytochrome d ubiquinol oxidase subunit II [Fimbriimonadaceae bacterium]|nr:cytochrome d ubiquinol oxidase subunit II [Fimbriimonadaceae bacterium]
MIEQLNLPVIWYILIGVLFVGYAILDGFDLGTGMILLTVKGDQKRRILLNAIGPVWDGNEVWLLVGGGALFAAFPDVYATVFSGFYLPLVLLLVGLIFRAVAIEFRSREEGTRWRNTWDISFSVASYVITLLLGVAMGNMVVGIPVDAAKEYTGGFFNLLNPYALVTGITTIALFMMHGTIYLVMKTQGELQAEMKARVKGAMIFFGVMFGLVTMATLVFVPNMAEVIRSMPWLFLLPVALLLFAANIPREITKGRELMAFLSSCGVIVTLLTLFGLGKFPVFVPSLTDPAFSLTVMNTHSTTKTLSIMFIIALIGVPFVLAYTAAIYWVFRGKVKEEQLHY